MSPIERLDIDVNLPFEEFVIKGGDPKLLAEYLLLLVKTLQDSLSEISAIANLGVDLADGDAVYYQLKDGAGNYAEGSWRRIRVGDNLEDQVLLGGDSLTGTWTTAQTRERPE